MWVDDEPLRKMFFFFHEGHQQLNGISPYSLLKGVG